VTGNGLSLASPVSRKRLIDRSLTIQTGPTASSGAVSAGAYRGLDRRVNKSSVLVVGDDLLMAEALVSAFIQNGFLARTVPAKTRYVLDVVGCKPDLALLDIDHLDQQSTIELVTALRRAEVDVAVLGRATEIDRMRDVVMHAGASAVVDKSSPLTDLLGTFCRLLRHDSNETRVRRPAVEHGEGEPQAKADRSAFVAVLTGRERCILAELMSGHRAETIAANGCVSISTVRSQIKSILQKLGVNSQLAAVALAQQAGWRPDRSFGSMSHPVRAH
jgi:two-component system, NarL family, nitrate/nitrite response regulator NarL